MPFQEPFGVCPSFPEAPMLARANPSAGTSHPFGGVRVASVTTAAEVLR